MLISRARVCWAARIVVVLFLMFPVAGRVAEGRSLPRQSAERLASEALLASIRPTSLRQLVEEILERNPEIARARRRAAAAMSRVPQARAWPDPVVGLTWFVLPPETRVGPQILRTTLGQRMPWFGKLDLREEAALFGAVSAAAEIETASLEMLTEARRLFFELAFLAEHEKILGEEKSALDRFEQAANARYATGAGIQQEVIRIQAQITRVDRRILALRARRGSLRAALGALLDRPVVHSLADISLPTEINFPIDFADLRTNALRYRPEIAGLDAEIARHDSLRMLAEKSYRPDFTFGFGYTLVGRRDDPAGRENPPAGNGDDILSLSAAVSLPVRRAKLAAAVEEAQQSQWAAEEARRGVLAGIERGIGDLEARIPLLNEQLSLLDDVLFVQAREALESAEAAYTTGKLNSVDLLDAEVVLFEVRTSIARIRADLAIAHAELERATARPVPTLQGTAS